MNAFGGVIWQAGQHVGEPGLRIDIVELGGGDQRVDRSGAPAAFVGAGEGPVVSPERNGPQLAFGGVVRHAKAPVIEEAGEGVPAVEAVVDRFVVSLFLESRARCSRNQVSSSMISGRLRSWRTRRRSCGMRPLISRSMANSDIDALDRLGCDRRLAEPRQIEELAPCMRPARGFDDRTSLCGWPRRAWLKPA